jgi:nucleoside-diphosphate-sugar epimerase
MTVRAVVFGGAGFVGTHLCDRLLATGEADEVVAADIVDPSAPRPGVDHRRIDVREPIPLELAAGASETRIYNLAAVHRTPGHPTHAYYETNVLGALRVCEFARRVGATDIVFTSSIAVYGPGEDRKSEDTAPTPESAYGWSKWLAEEMHRSWRQEDSERRRLAIVRPAVVFGPGENGNFTRLAGSLARGMFFFPGRRDTVKACGYVDDLVAALLFVQARGEPETVFNFCYPRAYDIAEICEAFHGAGGLKRPRGTVPLLPMRLAAFGFEVLNALGLRNGINRDRIDKLVRSTNIAPDYLERAGFAYETTLEEAIRRWHRAAPAGRFV